MAKLSDLTDWMTRALRGDAPRARSMVQIARKAGVFTTGGRGRGSPEQKPQDAAIAALLVLMDTPPTRCVQELDVLKELVVGTVEIAPDGQDGVEKKYQFGSKESLKSIPLPEQYSEFPNTPLAALTAIFDGPKQPDWLDSINLYSDGIISALYINVHDTDKKKIFESSKEGDFFKFKLCFWSSSENDIQPDDGFLCRGVSVERSLGSGSLVDLYQMINNSYLGSEGVADE